MNRSKYNRHLFKAGLFLAFSLNVASASEGEASDDALHALLQVLQQETEIATKTKMNIDFVPGMVSVLYGEDLKRKGVRTVKDAMALIPGVELSMTSDGQYQILMRGIGNAWASGKIKVLLNNIPFNSTLSVATTAYSLPIEQIERIEVIRGPGSAIYGEFAYSGVINIITRKTGNNVFVRYGSLGRKSIGGLVSHRFEQSKWDISVNFSATNADGNLVNSGPDILAGTPMAAISRAPGPVNEKEENHYALLHASRGDFSLSIQYGRVGRGDAFGIASALPDPEPRIMRRVGMLSVNAKNQWLIQEDLSLNAHVGWLDYKLASGLHEFYPPGYAAGAFPDGLIGSPNYQERKYRAGFELDYKATDTQDILMGFEWVYTDQGDTFARRNYDAQTFAPLLGGVETFRGDGNWLEEDLSRRVFSYFVQDQITVNERLTVTAGLRHDEYNDVGGSHSLRLASVFRADERHTVKGQYARAFRPPTFLESAIKNNPIASSSEIRSEFIDTYEIGYIYNSGMSLARVTAFYSDLRDLIGIATVNGKNTYVNIGKVNVLGIETEFVKQLTSRIKFDANATLMHSEDLSTITPIAGVANILANVGINYKISPHYFVVLQYRYVGNRFRQSADSRKGLAGYNVMDVTLTVDNYIADGSTFRFGVKNLFDEDVRFAAPLVNLPGFGPRPAYGEDYPRPGREYWLQAEYQF